MNKDAQANKLQKITVVTAVLNGRKFIRETIESVLSQNGNFELEYIIRDGESTDGTLEIIEEYKDRLTVVSKRDGSPQEAINAGFEMASGDILCWLNADDLFEPNALSIAMQNFEKNPSKDWLYGRCSIIDFEGNRIQRLVTIYKNLIGYFYSRHILLCENFINQPATFWRKDLWLKCNNLSTKYKAAWDYELWLKMSLFSKPIVVRKYLSRFRRHDESISENQFETQFKEELEIGKMYGKPIHNIIHEFNRIKIVTIYKLMNWLKAN